MKHVILVIGLARGGTTAVSSILEQLGYRLSVPHDDFTEDSRYPRPEGGYLACLLDKRKYEKLKTVLEETSFDLCFKRPDLIKHPRFLKILHPAHQVIIVYRDPVAIARRRCQGNPTSITGEMMTLGKESKALWNAYKIIVKRGCPHITVSYEHLMNNTGPELLRIAHFAGREPVEGEVERLKRHLQERRRLYRFRHNQKRMEGTHAWVGANFLAVKLKRFFADAPMISSSLTVRKVMVGSDDLPEGRFRQFNLSPGTDGSCRILIALDIEEHEFPETGAVALETSDGFARTYRNDRRPFPDEKDWLEATNKIM